MYFVVGEQLKKTSVLQSTIPFLFLKKDKAAYTSLRKDSQLFTANNHLEISGYHMRIVGFFLK